MNLKDFDFILPDELIAHHPAVPRDSSKLLVISEKLTTKKFSDLPELLKPNDLLVFNNSKVIPARLFAEKSERKFEFLLHKRIADRKWLAFAKPGKKLQLGDELIIDQRSAFKVIAKHLSGEVEIEFDDESVIEKYGQMPLPPYIKRSADKNDLKNYQTIYAKHLGSVAAPTAGLHFTDELLAKIPNKAFVTLHVGAGTFQPVKIENIGEHVMHSEVYSISSATEKAINLTKQNGGRVIAVGTTSLRVLEASKGVKSAGETQIFIRPGYKFKVADGLITNFHLPKSTLFMLTCALAGIDKMKTVYDYAIKNNFRFYSYGDACFIEKS